MSEVIVKTRYKPQAWIDPWGFPDDGYVLLDSALLVEKTVETETYDYGYGPQHAVECVIWRAKDGRLFKAIPPMDYGAGTRFVDMVSGQGFDRIAKRRYVRDGVPITSARIEEDLS
jgi:hypothetical protein